MTARLDDLLRNFVLWLALMLVCTAASAQAPIGTTPRPAIEPDPLSKIEPGESVDYVVAFAEMSCTQLAQALKWHETRTVSQQIAAWNAAMRALPPQDPKASSGEYLRLIEKASLEALQELLVFDLVSLESVAFAADRIDKATYLSWIRNTRGDALDELARRTAQSLGLQAGMPVTNWGSSEWRDLVRRRAVAQAERMRLEGVYRSPNSAFALRRVVAILGPLQKAATFADYFANVIASFKPLLDAAGSSAQSLEQVTRRARELSGLMREGERMRLSYALRCGPESVADAGTGVGFQGMYEGMLGRVDFSPDGSYVFVSVWGTRVTGKHRVESGRVFLSNWQPGAEQWFNLRDGCLAEPLMGKEMFCRGREPR